MLVVAFVLYMFRFIYAEVRPLHTSSGYKMRVLALPSIPRQKMRVFALSSTPCQEMREQLRTISVACVNTYPNWYFDACPVSPVAGGVLPAAERRIVQHPGASSSP
jgi:hypothetical protein